MRLVVETAKRLGQRAVAPPLAGLGTHARDRAPRRFDDWVAGGRPLLARERARGPVVLAGLSLGSLLATQLVLENDRGILALVLMANAFFLAPFPAWPLRAVDHLPAPDFWVPKFGADIGDPRARSTHLTYSAQPVRAAVSVVRAGLALFERLSEVRCPTLVVHGAKDRLCPVSNAWRVAERLGSADTRVVILPRSHHIVTRDFDSSELARELTDLGRRWLARG
jgi:pimeloyl-ACP methyl ester carboxylesterase